VTITINSTIVLPTSNGAIKVRNEWVLWQAGDQRGRDIELAGIDGLLPRRRFLTATTHTLELVISGYVRVAGGSTTPPANLEANVAYLRDTVCQPTGTGDGTKELVLTMPSGGTMSGDVHVLNFRFGRVIENGAWGLATLDVSIPAGELTIDTPPPPP
jgi:hypothetical protein